jgi:hypothetical protein
MTITDWRTSSYSGGENNDCVQVANTLEALRDSKNPDGGILRADVHRMIELIRTTGITR